MLATVQTAAVQGVEPLLVTVEVHLGTGLPSFAVVGLPQGAVREGRERVAAALRSTGAPLSNRKITVNLAPADVRKDGTAFDLPIAVGLLAAARAFDDAALDGCAFIGELGLDGSLRPVRGALPMAAACRAHGVRSLVVPEANAFEAGVVAGIDILGAPSLAAVLAHLHGTDRMRPVRVNPEALLNGHHADLPDVADVRGQGAAKRALEIAASGSHNLLFVGPPGSGKTMLARRLAGILPPLSLDEALETTRVHSVAGCLGAGEALVTRRPFRAPHHTVSYAALVGGGVPIRPGEVSLAHHGVLFMDELAEFRRHVLDVLRQPLEAGRVQLSRAHGAVRYPARILLVAAMNPCPCGYWGDGTDRCLCDPAQVRRYLGRVSGPLMDRIDLHVHVPPVSYERLSGILADEDSRTVRERVTGAREIQVERFRDHAGVHANGQMGPTLLRRWCRPSVPAARLLQEAVDRMGLSARSYHRILKVARTLADLRRAPEIDVPDVAEALQYRYLDRVLR